jgi:TRAP-type C4-dicarboxylate transport system permease small subunit
MKSLLLRLATTLGRLNGPLSVLARNLSAALLAVMLALALAQIVSRGLFHYSLDWAEELARVALVWSVLLTAPYAYRKGAHVAIVSFAEALPPRLLASTSLLLNLLILWILGVLFAESFAFWARGLEIMASTLGVKMAWVYAVVPAAFAMLILVGLELLARLLLHLAGAPSGIVMEGAMPAVVGD